MGVKHFQPGRASWFLVSEYSSQGTSHRTGRMRNKWISFSVSSRHGDCRSCGSSPTAVWCGSAVSRKSPCLRATIVLSTGDHAVTVWKPSLLATYSLSPMWKGPYALRYSPNIIPAMKTGGAWGTYVRQARCTQRFSRGDLRETNHLKILRMDRRINRSRNGTARHGLGWWGAEEDQLAGACECGNEHLGSTKWGESA
jgi:hypothetical protein